MEPASDRTKAYDYDRLVDQERRHFVDEAVVTGELRLGGIHSHAAWGHYWQRVLSALPGPEVSDAVTVLRARFGDAPLRILSVGSGYCGEELALARRLEGRCRVLCTDLNPEPFEQARARAREEGLDFTFAAMDLNFAQIEPRSWDLIFAHAALHHVINLEHLFDQLRGGLVPGGLLSLVEVTGENRRLFWKENERFARSLMRMLPRHIRGWSRMRVPVHSEGMEGIRQQEILPILHRSFAPLVELRHGAFMRAICLHRRLGPQLDPRDPERRRWLDWLIDADQSAVARGLLQPVEVWGLYEGKG